MVHFDKRAGTAERAGRRGARKPSGPARSAGSDPARGYRLTHAVVPRAASPRDANQVRRLLAAMLTRRIVRSDDESSAQGEGELAGGPGAGNEVPWSAKPKATDQPCRDEGDT
jgi:hypothetical protein